MGKNLKSKRKSNYVYWIRKHFLTGNW